jgi:hypothetical protein
MQHSKLRKFVTATTDSDGNPIVTIPAGLFRNLLIAALQKANVFDEAYYLNLNGDIRQAVQENKIVSAEDHYLQTGYFEGRMPKKILVNEKYYLEQNPDVVQAIRKGIVRNAQEHFDFMGFSEGRTPFEDFTLF